MKCETYTLNALEKYKYVVVLSWYEGRIMLSRHKRRDTWETQGGHIEQDETPMDAARRELIEESGAEVLSIEAAFDYWAADDESGANGMVFTAQIARLNPLPSGSEMEEIGFFDMLPENLTYPDITPKLFAYHRQSGK